MSIEIIGNDVLPNLYVKSISLTDSLLQITLSFFDYVNKENKITWLTYDFLRIKNLNLNLIVAKNNSFVIDFLRQPDYNLYDLKDVLPRHEQIINTNETHLKKELFDFQNEIKQKLQTAAIDSYIEINHTFNISINQNEIIDLNCYSFFSYDAYQEEDSYFLDDSGRQKKMLVGPIFSEVIIEQNRIKEKTNYHTVNGIPYSGPVHFEEGKLKEGSVKTEKEQREVVAFAVPNLKISSKINTNSYTRKLLRLDREYNFFSEPKIAIADKKMYGFFKFSPHDYFESIGIYNFFIGSVVSFNVFKIIDYINLKIDGVNTEIKQIAIENNSDEMWFYFEKSFNTYSSAGFNFEFSVTKPLSLIKLMFEQVLTSYTNYQIPINTVLASNNTSDFISFNNTSLLQNYIKGYVSVLSLSYEMNLGQIAQAKKQTIISIYKRLINKNALKQINDHYTSLLQYLNLAYSSIRNAETSDKVETNTIFLDLKQYENCITYLGGRKLIDPDKITEHLELTNSRLTQMEGLFQNVEQLFAPRYIRNSTGGLAEIDYLDITNNDLLLQVLQPEETQEINEQPDLDVSVPTLGSVGGSVGEEDTQTVEDPGVEPPISTTL